MSEALWIGFFAAVIFSFTGIRIVRPTHRGLVERFGKYKKFCSPGFQWIIPIVDQMYQVNITEQMVDSTKQEIITKDNLNAIVDAQVYFKVRDDEKSVKGSQYNVQNYKRQIVSLARTTLRNIIGNLKLMAANSDRQKINVVLQETLEKETMAWGIDVVRTELKEIEPPKDVQKAMNQVVVAENDKIYATDFSTAVETKADGEKRANIKDAEGIAQAIELRANANAFAIEVEANAKAKAIEAVNNATESTFTTKAQVLRKLEAVEKSLQNNTKVVLPAGESLVNVIGGMAEILPVPMRGRHR